MKYTSSIVHRGNLIFSFKFWLLTILLVLIYSSVLFAQYTNTVYLDPTNSGDPSQDGTVDHPYDHITDVTVQANTEYLFKRGTMMTITSTILVNQVGDWRFGAYGPAGEMPIITTDAPRNIIQITATDNVVIDSLEILNYNNYTAGIHTVSIGTTYNLSWPNTTNTTISNCKIHKGYVGINTLYLGTRADGTRIINCEVYDVGLDGIFLRETANAEIIGCHIHDVNQIWHYPPPLGGHGENPAGGDGIQLTQDCDNFKVYNNIIDRRNTGNKFCFIWGGLNNDGAVNGEIVGNTFYGPKDTTDNAGGVAVYLARTVSGYEKANILFARNTISGRKDSEGNIPRAAGTYDSDTVIFAYNILDSINGNLGASGITPYCSYSEVYNNTIVSPISANYVFQVASTEAKIKNNLVGGNTTNDPLRVYGVTSLDSSYNYQIHSSSPDLYNSYLSIANWETGDYTRTSNLNDGIDLGLIYDYDSLLVSNPPEKGTCEYSEGGQSNSPPTINNQTFGIAENSGAGETVGMVIANDPDQGQTLTYSIISGNTGSAFQVNSGTGELTVNNSGALDYETTPTFNLTIKVQDNGIGPLSDQAITTINLININEMDQPATWLDNNSTNWNIASNWNTGLVPDENTIVNISGGLQNYPLVQNGEINIGNIGNGDYNCRTISINNGGKIETLNENIINIYSEGALIVNDGGTLNNGGTLNINDGGMLYVMGIINCSFDGNNNGNMIFYSGSGGFLDGGSITVFRSLQFFPGTNWYVEQGNICCGGIADEVLIVLRDEDVVLDNLKINEGVSAQFVSGFYTYPLIIEGDLILEANSNFTNSSGKVIKIDGSFLLESDEKGTASFVNYGSIDISGQTEVQSYLESDRWHNISLPLTSDTAGVFMDMFLYSFDEASYSPNANIPSGWINIVDENTHLNVGDGYKVWSYSSMLGSEKISFTGGELNDGIIDLPVYATDQDFNNNIGDGEGWNLIGNPYASGIDWDHQSWLKQNIEGSVYVFDGSQYLVWSGIGGSLTNGIIPAMQAFFVKANNFDPSLTIYNNSRIHGECSYKESSIDNLLVISVEGKDFSDKTYINFNVNGTNGFDGMFDAYKLKGIAEAPQLFTYANNKTLTINVLPELVSDTM